MKLSPIFTRTVGATRREDKLLLHNALTFKLCLALNQPLKYLFGIVGVGLDT